jgi:hypothetical protein
MISLPFNYFLSLIDLHFFSPFFFYLLSTSLSLFFFFFFFFFCFLGLFGLNIVRYVSFWDVNTNHSGRLVVTNLIKYFKYYYYYFFYFDMSAQEGEGGFELVTTTSLSVVPAD